MMAVLRDAQRILGWRLPALTALMLCASVLEGIGLSMLLPLLASFGLDGGAASPLTAIIENTMRSLGVPRELGPLMTVVVVVLVLQVSATFLRARAEAVCTTRVTAAWRVQLFGVVMRASWPYLQGSSASAQANAIVNDSSRVSAALSLALQMINASMLIIVYALISLTAAWQMVVFLLAFGSAIYLLTRPISRRSREVGEEVTEVSRALLHHTQEFLASAKLIKATATEATAASILAGAVEAYRRTYVTAAILPAAINFIYMAAGYVVLGFGVWAALSFASVAPGAIIVSIYVFLRLYVQLSNLQQLRQAFALSAPALKSVQVMRAAASAAAEHVGVGRVPGGRGPARIEVEGLRVDYAGHVALHEVDAALAAGSVLGITGPSGAGKSTFVDAVVGLLEASAGRVLIDGEPLGELDVRAWRRQIGYVAQDTLLVQGSVSENIAWGAAEADTAAIEAAARMAGAHDFVAAMPQGYATLVGGRGVRMSGGQRQRIGLARALLGAKRLLILDEATSALDSDSESQVLDAVERLRGQMTMIVVAHRLSTLQRADSLLVFEAGRVVESGTFSALRDGGGRFGQLWAMQTAGPAVPSVDAEVTP